MAGGTVTLASTPMPTPTGIIQVGPFNINVANPIGEVELINFAGAGYSQVAFPNTATVAVIVPPPANATALSYGGANTDVCGGISPNTPSMVSLAPGQTYFFLRSAGAVAGAIQVLVF